MRGHGGRQRDGPLPAIPTQRRQQVIATRGERVARTAVAADYGDNSFTMEVRGSSSKRTGGVTPIRALIDEEMLIGKELERPSPTVIAKLMGLDSLPPLPRKQEISSIENQGVNAFFEVAASSISEKYKNQAAPEGMACQKENEKALEIVRRKLMDANRLLTDNKLHNSKELSDALEFLNSNKDIFLKFLQEPKSSTAKDFHDSKCSPPSAQPRRITILKSSRGSNYGECCEVFDSSKIKEECSTWSRRDMSLCIKPMVNRAGCSTKEHESHSEKLLKPRYIIETDAHLHPTRIVVMKPNLEKVQETTRTVSLPSSTDSFQFGFRKHRKFELYGTQELHEDGRERLKLSDSAKKMRHKAKGSKEIAREIINQMRPRHLRDEGSRTMLGMPCSNNSEASERTLDNNCHPSSSCSTESSLSRDARKRLSERWKRINRYKDAGLYGRGPSTLGEMLALSDEEMPRRSLDSLIAQNARHEVLVTQGCPLDINSTDSWKNSCVTNLPRSTSPPASWAIYGTPKPSSRHNYGSSHSNGNCYMSNDMIKFERKDSLHEKFVRERSSRRSIQCGSEKLQSLNSGGEENKLRMRETYVDMAETWKRVRAINLAEDKKAMLSGLPDNSIANVGYLVKKSLCSKSMDVKLAYMSSEEQDQQPAAHVESSAKNQIDKSIEEASYVHIQDGHLPSWCDRIASGSPGSSQEAEQPSSISVIEPPSEEERYSSGCFERISANLQALRMQLQCLKLESEDNRGDQPQLLTSDEDTGGEHHSVLQSDAIDQASKDDARRDFSYLIDVLVGSGIHGANQDELFSACYLPAYPVDPAEFEKFEKKYGMVATWPKFERKLLFDQMNAILEKIFAHCIDLQPWVKSKRRCNHTWSHEKLAEEVWVIVVRQRKELRRGNLEDTVLDPEWLELGDEVNAVGREIERMLKEELLEELVSEFILTKCFAGVVKQ